MKYQLTVSCMAIVLMTGCAMLTDLAIDAISPDKGGINTELVLGDKEQALGNNQDVKAGTIGKVVGTNDNSVIATRAKEVTVNNINVPIWLTLLAVLGWMSPTPTNMFNYMRNKYNGRF